MNVHRVLSYIHCAVAIFSFQCNLTVLWNWWLFQISIFHQLQLIMINFHEIHIVALFLSLRTLVRSKWSWEQFMSINPLLRSWFASCLVYQGHKPNQFELCICFRCCSKISSVPIRLWVLPCNNLSPAESFKMVWWAAQVGWWWGRKAWPRLCGAPDCQCDLSTAPLLQPWQIIWHFLRFLQGLKCYI